MRPLRTTDAAYRQRREACVRCPHHDATRDRCQVCGCLLQYKLRVPSFICPVGKFGKAD